MVFIRRAVVTGRFPPSFILLSSDISDLFFYKTIVRAFLLISFPCYLDQMTDIKTACPPILNDQANRFDKQFFTS